MAQRRSSLILAPFLLGLGLVAGCSASANGSSPQAELPIDPVPPASLSVKRSIIVQKERVATLDLAALGLGGHFNGARVRTDGSLGSFRVEGDKAIYTPQRGREGVDHSTIFVDQGDGGGVDVEVYADLRPCFRVPADLGHAANVHVIGIYESGTCQKLYE